MNRKLASLAFVVMLSLSAFIAQSVDVISANFFPPSVPSTAIIIKSDGSLEPSTASIQQVGDVYSFKEDIAGYGIVIQRNNVIIDGAGYALQGNGNSTGVFLQDTQNVTVKNLTIEGFSVGVWFTWGLSVDQGAKNNIIKNNTITNNTYGINCALFTSSNTLTENTITNNEYGIYIAYSPNNVLRNNRLNGNEYNMWVDCLLSNQGSAFINDIDTSNSVDGKPVYYWVSEKDKSVPSNAGYVALVRCLNITVQGLNLSHNGQGILLVETNNSSVTGNIITYNNYGVALFGMYEPCTNNTVSQNQVSQNAKNVYTYLDDSVNTIGDNTGLPWSSPTPNLNQTPSASPSPSPSAFRSTTPSPTPTSSSSESTTPLTSPSPAESTPVSNQNLTLPQEAIYASVLAVAILIVVASVFSVRRMRQQRGS
jgi:parallel beta-helix repeat protein